MKKLFSTLLILGLTSAISSAQYINPVKMKTMSDVYYTSSTDSKGVRHNTLLDKAPGISHCEYKEKGYYNSDEIKFDLIADLYIDTDYPTKEIQSYLFKKVDKELFDGFYDVEDGDSAYWAQTKAYMKPNAKEFIAAWKPIMRHLSHKERVDKKIKYTNIAPTYFFVACHKVHEDDVFVTYLVENGNNPHGGCGCRNRADYLTFNKSTGKVLTKDDLLRKANKKEVSDALYLAYKKEFKYKTDDYPNGTIDMNEANGVAILDEGILFYYYPYTIGIGAEGQYNLVIDDSWVDIHALSRQMK